MTGKVVGITVDRVADVLVSGLSICTILRKACNHVTACVICPYRCKGGIFVGIPLVIGRCIVDAVFGTEMQSLEQRFQIEIEPGIELKLTTYKLIVSCRIGISYRVGGIELGSSEKIFTVNEIIAGI